MRDLIDAFLELVRRASTDLPEDVEQALRRAMAEEEAASAAHSALEAILQNVSLARRESSPVCQDTGTPIFFVRHPQSWSTRVLREQIRSAVAQATAHSYLRPNAVDSITGANSGNNLGDEAFPTIHFEEIEGDTLTADLILKGGGCENVGAQYSLPHDALSAGRDLAGVRKVVLDAVYRAQGMGCAPGILGVAVGGDRGSSFAVSKEVLLRKLGDTNADPKLDALEKRLTQEANQLGIGPMGFGGKTTVLDVKVRAMHRLPASFFVSVSYMCWAHRRRRMVVQQDRISYE